MHYFLLATSFFAFHLLLAYLVDHISIHAAFASLGYREVAAYVRGEIPLVEAATRTKLRTHRYVRQQQNWFRQADPRITWLDASAAPLERALPLVEEFLSNRTANEGRQTAIPNS